MKAYIVCFLIIMRSCMLSGINIRSYNEQRRTTRLKRHGSLTKNTEAFIRSKSYKSATREAIFSSSHRWCAFFKKLLRSPTALSMPQNNTAVAKRPTKVDTHVLFCRTSDEREQNIVCVASFEEICFTATQEVACFLEHLYVDFPSKFGQVFIQINVERTGQPTAHFLVQLYHSTFD